MKSKYIRNIIRCITFIIFGIGVMYYFANDNIDSIVLTLSDIKIYDLSFLCLMSSSVYLIQGIIFKRIAILKGFNCNYKDGIQIIYVSTFISNVFTPSIGKASQIALLKMKNKNWAKSFDFCIIDQILYFVPCIIICGAALFINFEIFASILKTEWIIGIIGYLFMIAFLILLILLYIPCVRKLLVQVFNFINSKLSHDKLNIFINSIIDIVNEFSTDNNFKNHKKEIAIIVLLNCIKIIIKHSLPYAIILVLNVDYQPNNYFLLFSASCLIDMALNAILIYGKHGVSEFGFVTVFSKFIDEVNATSTMLIWRVITFYINTLIGGIILALSPHLHLKDLLNDKNIQNQ